MSRLLDPAISGAWFHITSPSENKQRLFYSSSHCRYFMQALTKYSRQYGVQLHAYCLLEHQLSLLFYACENKLTLMLEQLFTRYAQRYSLDPNTTFKPFYSKQIDDRSELLSISSDINSLPALYQQAVEITRYAWSSYAYYIYPHYRHGCLITQAILTMMKSLPSHEHYRYYVEHRVKRLLATKEGLGSTAPVGCESLCDERRVIELIAAYFFIDASEVIIPLNSDNTLPRELAIYLIYQLKNKPPSQLAEYFCMGKNRINYVLIQMNQSLKNEPCLLDLIAFFYNALSDKG